MFFFSFSFNKYTLLTAYSELSELNDRLKTNVKQNKNIGLLTDIQRYSSSFFF